MYYTTKLPTLHSQQFDDEVLIANFETGLYYSLTRTAADIWLGLKSGASMDEIVAALSALGAPDATTMKEDVHSFIEKLVIEQIIAPHSGTPVRQAWFPQFSNPFSQPVLDRFDDLQELLLQDPVHDVSEAGWPTPAKDAD